MQRIFLTLALLFSTQAHAQSGFLSKTVCWLTAGNLGKCPALFIDGSSDQIQLTVQGHSTQTTSPEILLVEKSDGTDLFSVLATTQGTTKIGAGATAFRDTNAGADNTNIVAAIGRDTTRGSVYAGVGASAGTTSTISGAFPNASGNSIRGSAIFFNNSSTTTAGSETGDIELYTKPSGSAIVKQQVIDENGKHTFGSTSTPSNNHKFQSNGNTTIDLTANSTASVAAYNLYQSTTLQGSLRALDSGSSLAISTGDTALISYGKNLIFSVDSGTSITASFVSSSGAFRANNSGGGHSLRNISVSSDSDPVLHLVRNTTENGNEIYADFREAGSSSSDGTASGGIRRNSGDTAYEFFNASDARLKTDVRDWDEDALAKVLQLKPRSYRWIKNPGREVHGFVAQEVREIIPDMVGEDERGYLNVGYSELYPYLVKSIQQLASENDALKARLTSLEARLDAAGF